MNFDASALCRSARDISIHVARRKFRFPVHEAEDVAQEMALRALIRARDSEVTPAWIYTGATFVCLDMLRKNGSRTRADALIPRVLGTVTPDDERLLDLRQALLKLPTPAQETLWQYFWEGRTWAEIDAQAASGKRESQYRARKSLALLSTFMDDGSICKKTPSRV